MSVFIQFILGWMIDPARHQAVAFTWQVVRIDLQDTVFRNADMRERSPLDVFQEDGGKSLFGRSERWAYGG
jgi:hypothetical protein